MQTNIMLIQGQKKKLFSVSIYGLHRVEELIFHFHGDCFGVL